MPDYIYERALLPSGRYDINHPDRLNGEGYQVHLSDEIAETLTGKSFKVICTGTECKITFVETLTTEEENTLDTIVANHKSNS